MRLYENLFQAVLGRKSRRSKEIYLSLNPAELKRMIDRKLTALYEISRKKKKRSITMNPYKR